MLIYIQKQKLLTNISITLVAFTFLLLKFPQM